MTTKRDHIAEAVDATLEKRAAEGVAEEHLQRRRWAIWQAYHVDKMAGPAIARAMREVLLARGVTEDELRGIGVGYDSIRKIIEAPEPEGR